jgi:hypothetical protein
MLGWEGYIERWDSRDKTWYMPIYYVNYVEQELQRNSRLYTTAFRYISMLYYGIINIGSNELGPVNRYEYLFFTISLIISAILKAIIFGDIVSLMQKLGAKGYVRQYNLDGSN